MVVLDPLANFKNHDLAKREENLAQSAISSVLQNKKLTSEGVRHDLPAYNRILINNGQDNPYADSKTRTTYA